MATARLHPPRSHASQPNAEPARRRFTVDEYYRMAEAGILRPDERVELIDGEIITMAAIGSAHAAGVDRSARWFNHRLGDRAHVRIQNPVRLSKSAEPEPDIALLVPRTDFYASAHPGSADVLLIIELAHSSLAYDRYTKVPMYARARIAEVWVVDLEGRRILVYREPVGSRYRTMTIIDGDGAVTPLAFPDLVVGVADLLGAPSPKA